MELPAPSSLALVSRVLGLVSLVLTVIYAAHSSKSLEATTKDNVIYGGLSRCFACNNGWNWHPVLMTLAFVVFMTESLLAFKAPLVRRPDTYKWVHMAGQTGALAAGAVGMAAIIKAKLYTQAYHMYSVHAWTGAVVFVGFAVQYLVGLAVFGLGAVQDLKTRAAIAEWHSLLGKITFFAGICSCVTGWADIQMMMVDSNQYTYGSATMLGSATSMLLWALALTVAGVLLVGPPRRASPRPRAFAIAGAPAAAPAANGAAAAAEGGDTKAVEV